VTDPLRDKLIDTFEKIENKEIKQCSKCGQFKELSQFFDKSLSTGYGRICTSCKHNKNVNLPQIKSKSATPKCPKCNGSMLIKKSAFGEFYGCAKFPICNGKRNIK
jgi:DNA-directed RNA polymerase subunit RPC12/RpoP